MQSGIYLVVGIIIGYIVGRNWKKTDSSTMVQSDKSDFPNADQIKTKREHLNKIISDFGPEDEITNEKVQHMLSVSDATAERYLDELEKSGKLSQYGKTGKYVIYKKI